MSYTHLSELERELIARQLQAKQSKREIARQLGRNVTSICREVKKSCDEHGQYRPIHAHQSAHQKRRIARRPRKLASSYTQGLWVKVKFKLERDWSPRQISLWLQRAFPDTPTYQVSHSTIYHHIERLPKGELKRQLLSHLRQEGKKRKSSRRGNGKTWIKEMIHARPGEVELRARLGDFEGDLLLGAIDSPGAVDVLYERTSRRVSLIKLERRDAYSAYQGFANVLRRMPEEVCLTMTYDQGSEMAEHQRITDATGIKVYFCDPHSPWQRGGVENVNGLLRQYVPKGMQMSELTQYQLHSIALKLNERPREILNGRSPNEVWTHMLAGLNFEEATNQPLLKI
ncbi:IS30 family transposase [Undibacterium sp. Ren11W]|uniref:IS30 family transposase n=1 Tax=Undibacterium sp. Ren11W TaxID=3413045 RepID=UPI003BF4267E